MAMLRPDTKWPANLQDVLDLIEKPLGIIDLLDEQCKFPRVRSCCRVAACQSVVSAGTICWAVLA
jgi:hypothetical protein